MTRLLSFILTLVLVFYVIPSTIYVKAQELLETDESDAAVSVDASESSASSSLSAERVGVLFEDESLREESTKHFHLEDGTYLAAQYNYPVHTLDANGEWQDIDNVLSESGKEFTNNSARIKFAKKINGSSELFTLHDGNAKITMTLIGANKGTSGEVTNNSDAESESKLQKMMNLEKLSSRIIYRDILDGVDLEYIAYSMNVKENIIVKERKDSYSYSFELKLNGLTPTLTERGDIELRSDDTDELTYVIPAPVVYDSVGEHAPGGISAYTLTHINGKKYMLTVTVESEWMNKEERAFPVTIDPAVTAAYNSVVDTYVDSSNTTYSGSESSTLYVTSTKWSYWKNNSLPSIPTSANIINATIKIQTIGSTASGSYVGVHKVVTAWDPTHTVSIQATYGDGSYMSIPEDYCKINGLGTYYFDITKLTKEWYAGFSTNYGVAFLVLSGYTANVQFYSNEAGSESSRPTLTITYKDMKGVESYWAYSSHSAGVAGSGSVNLASGNLVFAIPTLTTTDGIFGYTPTLIYNSYLSGELFYDATADTGITNPFLGAGFKLNLNETLRRRADSNGEIQYIHSDADGTEHYFFNVDEGTYVDDDGLGLTLTELSSGDVSMTDDAKTTRMFEKVSETDSEARWRLSYVEDINGNRLVFTYSTINNSLFKPTKVSLLPNGNTTYIDLLEFHYNSLTGKLTMVYNPSAKTAVVFRYSITYDGNISSSGNMYLRQIDHAYGSSSVSESNWNDFISSGGSTTNITVYSTARYNYDSSGRLTEAISSDSGKSVKYTWQNGRVSQISEYAGSTKGQEVGFAYDVGFAEVRSTGNDEVLGTGDDILKRYTLDIYGRAVSVYSCSSDGKEIYGASYGVYDTAEESKNSLVESAVLGDFSANLLINGDFQGTADNVYGIRDWVKSSTVSRYVANNIESPETLSVSMLPEVSEDATIYQDVSLKAGTYTLSMQYKTKSCAGISGAVEILDASTLAILHTEEIEVNTGTVIRKDLLATTFTLSSDVTARVRISFSASSDPASQMTISVGKAKLEAGIDHSKFNLVSVGGFDDESAAIRYWLSSSSGAGVVNDAGTSNNCFKLPANMGDSYAKQVLHSKSAALLSSYNNYAPIDNPEHQFTVAGYAKADSPMPGKSFRLYVKVVYYYGLDQASETVIYPFDFALVPGVWQYVSGTLALDKDAEGNDLPTYKCIASVELVCDYSDQAIGYVYFDNISVVYSGLDATQSNKYKDGLLVRTKVDFDSTFYVYNENRNVSCVADSNGTLLEYTYDTANTSRVKSVTESTYTYNGSNNYYPYDKANHSDLVAKTPKLKTEYTYNQYGMVVETVTREAESDGSDGDVLTKQSYVYETGSTSKIFGALISEKNADTEIKNYYDTSKGWLIASFNVESRNGYVYNYDGAGRLIRVNPATYNTTTLSYTEHTNIARVIYEYDASDRLSKITTSSTVYNLDYDSFGNSESISVGTNELANYEYNENNGKLKRVTYGNGYAVEYVYNELEQLECVKYRSDESSSFITAYEYEYTADGQIYLLKDNINGRAIVYVYDESDRLEGCKEYTTSEYESILDTTLTYNTKSELIKVDNKLTYLSGTASASDSITRQYTYLDDGKLSTYNVSSNLVSNITYTYDSLDRVSSVLYNNSGNGNSLTVREQYTYSEDTSYGEGALVASYINTVGSSSTTYTYTYNGDGYITQVQINGNSEIKYSYNYLGQLVSEDNDVTGMYYTYTYDNAGNITKATRQFQSTSGGGGITITAVGEDVLDPLIVPLPTVITNTYSYTNSQWGDLLTSYNGTAIEYDEIGNPLSYYNGSSYDFTWNGRRLAMATKGTKYMSFAYNSDGLRISKTVNDVTRHYVYDGDLLVAEYTDTEAIVYIYDAFNSPIGFKCRTSSYTADAWDVYWYGKNLQGDIVAVYNSAGTLLMSYEYTAWGGATRYYSNGGGTTTATKNNLTYRGYYYDSDLGMYYLQSRYYDPVICRFINADIPDVITATPTALTDKNLYAYCDNNPVMRSDHDGMFWGTLFDVVSLGFSIYDVYTNPDDILAWIGLAGDIIDLLPVISGVGEATDLLRISNGADNLIDAADSVKDLKRTTDNTLAVIKEAAESSLTKGDNYVYISRNSHNVIEYVGITNDFVRREAEWSAKGRKIECFVYGVDRQSARIVEQTVIETFGMKKTGGLLSNKINSISTKNSLYERVVSFRGKWR